MFAQTDLAVQIMVGLAAMNLMMAIAIYGLKLRNIRHRKIIERSDRKFKHYFTYIQANLGSHEPLRPPPMKMSVMELNVLQERLIEMIESITGNERNQLIELCRQMGLIDKNLHRLGKRSSHSRIEAAYYLGCMRAREAVSPLLDLLRQHPLDSSLFIIARAIAKCSRNQKEVRELVRILMSKGKRFPDMVVDIIKEAQVDQTAVYAELIREERPDVIEIGLCGLTEYTNPSIAAAVYRLLDHDNETIRKKAIEIYLRSSAFLPRNVIRKLMENSSTEIRLMTIQAISEIGNPALTGVMHKSLNDEDQRVVYASAIGLLRQGHAGITLFCEAAKERRDNGQDTSFQEIIEQELKDLSSRTHAFNHLTRYNTLLYTYEKTFGKTKRLYRVV